MAKEETPEHMRDEYLSRVAALFNQARKWTNDFDPEAKFKEEEIDIKEEPVNTYKATVLVIIRPDRKPVRLVPRGCWIIGAQGRVDMKSDFGTETFVFVSERGPAIRFDRTENEMIREQRKQQPVFKKVRKGWALIMNRQLGILPLLDRKLFCRLLEVLGQ